MSEHDQLTGALNRDSFHAQVASQIDVAQETGSGFALVYLNIDNMKHFNAHNGHQVGDEMLKRFVELVSPMLRGQDSLFRVGGDEFAFILPESGRGEALQLSQRICHLARERLAPTQPTHCGDKHCMGPAKISASIGIALFEQSLNSQSLLQYAEKKMVDAKCAGRDRVCV